MKTAEPGRWRNSAGFTVTEILIVIALIITLTGFGFSGFSGWQKKERVRSLGYEFAALLRDARMRAIEKHVSQGFIFSEDQYTLFDDTNGDCVLSDAEVVLRQVTVNQEDKGISMTTSPDDLLLRFDNKGFPKNKSGGYGECRVRFANEKGYYVEISLSALGRINIEESK